MGFQFTEVKYTNLSMRGISYRAFNFKDKVQLQLGLYRPSESNFVLTIYEELQNNNEARIVICAFHRSVINANKFHELLELLDEPTVCNVGEYRLPYQSIFYCPIRSDRKLMQTFYPYDVSEGVDGDLFAKLFEMQWIGSRMVDENKLKLIHDKMIEEFREYEIIHAIEHSIPRLL
jgi:hypothetical protein